jgi:hypothetical protein
LRFVRDFFRGPRFRSERGRPAPHPESILHKLKKFLSELNRFFD